MHNQATEWQAPAHFERRRLDIDSLLGEEPFWGRFWEHPELTKKEKDLLLKTREDLCVTLKSYGESSTNFGLMHADFNIDNLIYTDENLAVIDFDDTAYGWHIYDLTATLIEFVDDPDLEDLRYALLAGYQEYRPLATKDIDMLPDFQLIRGMAIIGWYLQRPEHAGQSYFTSMKDWVVAQCKAKDVLVPVE